MLEQLFISSAYAQDAAIGQEGSTMASFVPLVLIMVIMYFFLIRPQQKRVKAHQAMVRSAGRGDKVLTGGGIIGKIVKVDEDNDIATIEIADGVKIDVARQTIANVFNDDSQAAVTGKVVQSKNLKKKTANDN